MQMPNVGGILSSSLLLFPNSNLPNSEVDNAQFLKSKRSGLHFQVANSILLFCKIAKYISACGLPE
jgi:hypothetical protein